MYNMKITFLGIFLLGLISNSSHGQKAKDKTNQLNTGGQIVQTTNVGNENQYKMIEPFTIASKLWEVSIKNNVVTEIFTIETANRISEFGRDENGLVKSIRTKTLLNPDNNKFPLSYTDERYEQVIFVKNFAFIINIDNGTSHIQTIQSAEDVDKFIHGAHSFNSILALNKSDLKGITVEKIKEILKQYFIDTAPIVNNTDKLEEAGEADIRARNSIKDKKVVSISIDCNAEYIQYKKNVPYAIVAKLADGSTLRTETTSAYLDDYIIEIIGMEGSKEPNSLFNLFYYTPTDNITLKVTSKYNSKITTSKVFKVKYEIEGDVFNQGKFKVFNQAQESPYIGFDTRVEIKQVKDANTGETLLAYKIFDLNGEKVLSGFKCKPSQPVEVIINGRGLNSEAKGVGQNGFNGGNLKIIIDPSVTESHVLTYDTSGSKGQKGTAGNGKQGVDGTVEIVKQKVTW
jgi:hypothetical protein